MYELFPPPKQDSGTAVVLNHMLNSGNQDQLDALGTTDLSSMISKPEGLKSLSRKLASCAISSPVSDEYLKLPLAGLTFLSEYEDETRSTAVFGRRQGDSAKRSSWNGSHVKGLGMEFKL